MVALGHTSSIAVSTSTLTLWHPPAHCLLGKALALARFLTRSPTRMLTRPLLALTSPRIIVPRFSQLHAWVRSVHGRRVETAHFLCLPISTIRRLRHGKEPVGPFTPSILIFRHSHGGTGCGSTHNPLLASRASFSNPSSTASPGAYFLYHQHQPSLTSV